MIMKIKYADKDMGENYHQIEEFSVTKDEEGEYCIVDDCNTEYWEIVDHEIVHSYQIEDGSQHSSTQKIESVELLTDQMVIIKEFK